jgi:ABC-type sugar transport system permease subunit
MLTGGDLFLRALQHNLILLFGAGSITIALALFFAAALHRGVRGAQTFRIAFFFPNIIASVAVAMLWVQLYSTTDIGLVNAILGHVQSALSAAGIDWLNDRVPVAFTDSRTLIYALIPIMVWTGTGFYMVLFLAAMQSIPESYYDAAKLDGASPFAQFRHITLPLMREVLVVAAVFLIIFTMKFFDTVWVIENQYPTHESHVLATVLYQKVFSEYNIGYGAAVAVLLFIIVFAATLVTLRISRREALEY